ncbi:alpha/beta-hydrolase [Aulographum hederae CBS 113979]|uniref:Alpha/beta-hydrolase n=1 Tax=Aulographum hederae CBS 113979 TaxID=1176131 RepID=A0A6G1HD94_9PEZI|nr:alpha/beta-hydrolase [Aulographum hederae CBS 113979]
MATIVERDREEEVGEVKKYDMHVSLRYLELTKRKLELTRLPREVTVAKDQKWDYGVPKGVLEPLVDFWLQDYDWRAQEALLNVSLPQFRVRITVDQDLPTSPAPDVRAKIPPLRMHFVHKRCAIDNAIPLLYCHGWPGSFIEVSKMIDPLTQPVEAPGGGEMQAFHVVAPSIPGFGFSDAVMDEGFGPRGTADVFDALMQELGYEWYVVHGVGWGMKVARALALQHPSRCLAVHTVSPELREPSTPRTFGVWLKYKIARLTNGRIRPLSFGFVPSDFDAHRSKDKDVNQRLPDDDVIHPHTARPQTSSYALCDSPVALLSCIIDAIYLTSGVRILGPDDTPTQATPAWTYTDIVNWTMMQWLPGPEAALRWLRQARKESEEHLWNRSCNVPMGVSTYRQKSTEGEAPAAGGKKDAPTASRQPAWTADIPNLQWTKRREGETTGRDIPAWEKPDDVVLDLRECFGDLARRGILEVPSDDDRAFDDSVELENVHGRV